MIPQEYIQEVVRRNDIEEVIGQYVQLRRRGRTATGLCPFHNEKTPSFVVYPDTQSFYCFGCGATGDVIDLTAQLFGLSSFQAARKLTQDFGLSPDKPPSGAVALPKPAAASSDTQQEEIFYCLRVLHDYRDLLTRWQTEFAPLSPEEPLDEHFVEALHMMAVVDDLIDCLAFGPTSKKAAAAKRLLDGQLLPMVESRLNTLDREEAA